jgi:hypothetical protein
MTRESVKLWKHTACGESTSFSDWNPKKDGHYCSVCATTDTRWEFDAFLDQFGRPIPPMGGR